MKHRNQNKNSYNHYVNTHVLDLWYTQ